MASGAVFQLSSPIGYAAGFRLGSAAVYPDREYQMHTAALAERFGIDVPEPPPDPGRMTEYGIEDTGVWTVVPDCTLYSPHVHFMRIYVPM